MDSLKYENLTLFFEVFDDAEEITCTKFFVEKIYKRKLLGLIGPVVDYKKYEFLFVICEDITDPSKSKIFWKTEIDKEFKKYEERVLRKLEIERKEWI